MSEQKRVSPLLWGAAALVLLADQATKQIVRTSLIEGQSVSLSPWLSRVFRITYVTNSGVAFGLFPNIGQFFIVVGGIAVAALLWYSFQFAHDDWSIHLALGLQLGGATGNLVDRLLFGGVVVDFVDLSFWPLQRWPVFNLADASIVGGVTLLLLLLLQEESHEGPRSASLVTAEDD